MVFGPSCWWPWVLSSLLLPAGPNVTATSPAPRGRCSRFEFECQQLHKCIPNWKRCDGRRDCQDGTDERNCRKCGGKRVSPGSFPWDALCEDGRIYRWWNPRSKKGRKKKKSTQKALVAVPSEVQLWISQNGFHFI